MIIKLENDEKLETEIVRESFETLYDQMKTTASGQRRAMQKTCILIRSHLYRITPDEAFEQWAHSKRAEIFEHLYIENQEASPVDLYKAIEQVHRMVY